MADMNMRRVDGMLFDRETTMRTDFKTDGFQIYERTKYLGKTTHRKQATPIKDLNSLTEWKVPNVPFNLFWRPKDVIRTHPLDLQEPYYCVEDTEKEQCRRTRPRLVMTPAVKVDDADDASREVLLRDTYKTSAREPFEMTREIVDRGRIKVVAPLPGRAAQPGILKLPKIQAPLVPPEWRMESCRWENNAFRCGIDASKEFWLRKT